MNIASIIGFLRSQQQADGSFMAYASPHLQPFVERRPQPTLFTSILILDCLRAVYGTEDIRRAAANYVRDQVSQQGSWNYWDAASEAKALEPYPDDLDDTACALAALSRHDAAWVTSQGLGQFARLLVSAEQAVGGPYNTWLIDTRAAPQWQHCDLAVNANIGYALSLQSVCPRGLGNYIDTAIKTNSYTSDYYVGELPVVYFLSRWYDGPQVDKLCDKLRTMLSDRFPDTALGQAMLLTAACRLNITHELLQPLAQKLQDSIVKDHWPAAALYIDPVYAGQQHYGGSAALTTAFVLEALTSYAQPGATVGQPPKAYRSPPGILAQVRRDAAQIPDVMLRRQYVLMARRITASPDGLQISHAANLVAKAGSWRLSPLAVQQLNLGSLNGWIAYTLYDNLLDGSSKLQQLNVANIALRRSYDYFLQAAGQDGNFAAYVRQTFDTMDSANNWELLHARAKLRAGVIKITKLPSYGDYSQLAARSLGHSLAACGVLASHYGSMQHSQLAILQRFFKHFLIARQLNDDAHDWEADLGAGHLSAVVSLLLADSALSEFEIAQQLDSLRQRFWEHTIDEVGDLISHHILAARQALQQLDLNSETFETWLEALEASVASALHGRDEALQFMAAYGSDYA